MAWIAGVDGCKDGWIAGLENTDTGETQCRIFKKFDALLQHQPCLEIICIDIPIGLPDGEESRDCDTCARAKLGPRRSSVFPVPVRQVLNIDDYNTASDLNKAISKKGLSKQTFYLMPKILQVDQAFNPLEDSSPRIIECHPEVCFWAMNGKEAMPHYKTTMPGMLQRRGLLARHLGDVLPRMEAQASGLTGASLDDLYDAMATLWTARRVFGDKAATLPDAQQKDSMGRPMNITY